MSSLGSEAHWRGCAKAHAGVRTTFGVEDSGASTVSPGAATWAPGRHSGMEVSARRISRAAEGSRLNHHLHRRWS